MLNLAEAVLMIPDPIDASSIDPTDDKPDTSDGMTLLDSKQANQKYGRRVGLIVLYDRGTKHQPFATWWESNDDMPGERYHGYYYDTLEEARECFNSRD